MDPSTRGTDDHKVVLAPTKRRVCQRSAATGPLDLIRIGQATTMPDRANEVVQPLARRRPPLQRQGRNELRPESSRELQLDAGPRAPPVANVCRKRPLERWTRVLTNLVAGPSKMPREHYPHLTVSTAHVHHRFFDSGLPVQGNGRLTNKLHALQFIEVRGRDVQVLVAFTLSTFEEVKTQFLPERA